jgi:hypothetical protein
MAISVATFSQVIVLERLRVPTGMGLHVYALHSISIAVQVSVSTTCGVGMVSVIMVRIVILVRKIVRAHVILPLPSVGIRFAVRMNRVRHVPKIVSVQRKHLLLPRH